MMATLFIEPPRLAPAENDHERASLALYGGLPELSDGLESPPRVWR
jgi:hypothetical protein